MRTRARGRPRNWCFAASLIVAGMHANVPAQERALLVPGLVIEEILPDSAAGKAGFATGDRVLSYDATPLPSAAALQAAEENTLTNAEVAVDVQRGDETLMLMAPRGKLGIRVRPALPPEAIALYEEGRAAMKAQQAHDVVGKWTTAARAAQEGGQPAAAAWLYRRVGEIFEGQRQWKAASESHAAAWGLLKQETDTAAQSRTLVALGRCSQNVNDLPAALRWYEQAEKVDSAAGYAEWAAADATNLGLVANMAGDLAGAEDHHRRALATRERAGAESLSVAESLNNLGSVAFARVDLATALDYHTRALAIRDRLAPHSQDASNSLNNLGNVASARGEVDRADGYYRRALAITERLAPDSLAVAINLNNLGNVARERGDLQAAHDYHSRALAIRERLAPGSLVMSASLNNLGNVMSKRGDWVAAENYFQRSLAIKEPLAPDSVTTAITLNNLGLAAEARGDLAKAHDYLLRALGIRERLVPNTLAVAASLRNLGFVARSRGDLRASEDFHNRALRIRELLAPDSLAVAESLTELGLVVRSRDVAASRAYHARALGLRERLAPTSLDVVPNLNSHGAAALEQRRFSDALETFGRAVAIVEAQRWQIRSTEGRALMLAQHTESYAGLLRTHLALNDVAAAFATAERARARSLLEILTEGRAEIRQGVDPLLLELERELQRQINAVADRQMEVLGGQYTDEQAATVKKELDGSVVAYQEVQAQIRVKSPRYAALTQPQPLGLREIQQQVLDPDTVLLEYALGKDASYVFVVTPASIHSFELPKRSDIEMAARRVHELLTARQPVPGETVRQRQARILKADAEYPAAAGTLSRMVLGPVAGQLAGKRLLIVAEGALQYVPFAALPEPAAEHAQPLIVNHEIVSVPSASVVAVLRREFGERQPAERLVAVLADPVFDAADSRLKRTRRTGSAVGQFASAAPASLPVDVEPSVRGTGWLTDRGALSRLPFTRDEAEAILALAPAGQSTKAIDFNASRATITSTDLSRYRIVHLATHGVLNTEHPELSGIVLSLVDERGRPQDGFLRLHEVYNLNWSAELVVLSACQTALGKEIAGEGLVGLTRGFMYGGAERVLASLWNVNDSVTAQFMKRFYQGHLAQGLTPAAALRAAQVEMWKRKVWRSPYYWAAFVLQGEWR